MDMQAGLLMVTEMEILDILLLLRQTINLLMVRMEMGMDILGLQQLLHHNTEHLKLTYLHHQMVMELLVVSYECKSCVILLFKFFQWKLLVLTQVWKTQTAFMHQTEAIRLEDHHPIPHLFQVYLKRSLKLMTNLGRTSKESSGKRLCILMILL